MSSSCGRLVLAVAGMLGAFASGMGCVHEIDRFRQGPDCGDQVTTAAVDAVRAGHYEVTISHRPYASVSTQPKEGMVTHLPLYFEDPYEDSVTERPCVNWYSADYLHSWLYGPGRALVNAILFPVSAVVDPPWVLMASDGRPSRCVVGMKHDAQRWKEPVEPPPVVD